MMPRPRVLLPTPSRPGLLPHPVKKTLLGKRPLLQTPCLSQKRALLSTPQVRFHQPRPLIPNRPQLKPKQHTPNSFQTSSPRKSSVEQDGKIKQISSQKIYEEHKEKLRNKAAKNSVSSIDKSPLHKEEQVNEADNNPTELSCLASYLLQMKTVPNSPPKQAPPDSPKDCCNKTTSFSKTSDLQTPSLNDSMPQLALSSTTSSTSASHENESAYREKSVSPSATASSKQKKTKIQLSQYASGTEKVTVEDFNSNKITKSEPIEDALSEPDISSNSSFKSKQIKTPGHDSKSNDNSMEVLDNTYVCSSEPPPTDIKNKSNIDKTTVEQSCESMMKRKSSSDGNKQGESSTNCSNRIKDLPFILPVSGFFCDLCCDFFFDENSTLDHVASTQHHKKIKAMKKQSSCSKSTINTTKPNTNPVPSKNDSSNRHRKPGDKWEFVIPKRK